MKLTKLFIGGLLLLLLGSCKSTDCGCPMASKTTTPAQKKIAHSSNTMDYFLSESDFRSTFNSTEFHHHSDQKTCTD